MAAGRKTGGRKKGTPNKVTASLKQAILLAAENAGDGAGVEGYLTNQARQNPTAFMGLLGKVLPTTLQGDANNPLAVLFKTIYEAKK